MTGVRAAVSGLLAVVLLAACESPAAQETAAAAKALGTCHNQATPVALPEDFPASFPLPPHAVVVKVESRTEDRMIVSAISPDPERDVLAFLNRELPKAGFTLSGGEAEDNDAESDWSSPDRRGRWAIRAIPGCDNDTAVTVLYTNR